MAENTVFLLLTALVRNFYKFIMERLEAKKFGHKATSRIKAFVFKFITVPAKWIRTSRQFILNIYTYNQAYGELFIQTLANSYFLSVFNCVLSQVAWWGKGTKWRITRNTAFK